MVAMTTGRKKRRRKHCNPNPKICNDCALCIYIGEGDFICENEPDTVVIEDWEPTEDFMRCKGKEFIAS